MIFNITFNITFNTICNTVFIFLISKKICDFIFPTQMNHIYIHAGLYGLRTYASAYLFCQKLKISINKLLTKTTVIITCIKNGDEVKVYNLSQFKLNIGDIKNNNYDLVLYKEPTKNYDTYNVLRLYETQLIGNGVEYNISNIKFMDIKIIFNREKYNVDFSLDNFYINGNIILDRVFIQWYLKRYYGITIQDADHYTCHIMDHDINFIKLTPDNYILIEENGYILGV